MKKETVDKRTILFVDDTADTRDLVSFSLGREGFQVVTAQTAEEGLALAHRREFALILLDIGLPDKDGLELCREIVPPFIDVYPHSRGLDSPSRKSL